MQDKFPLRIVVDHHKKRFKAITSIDRLKGESTNIRQDLKYLEEDYYLLITTIYNITNLISQSRKKDPRLYWLMGEYIIRFLERIEDMGFYLIQQNSTLARDIGISESHIKKIISFRKRFSKLSLVNTTISWAKYRDNKVPVPIE